MIGRRAGCCLILLVVGMAGVKASFAECDALGAVRKQWERTRSLLLPISEAIPEEKYDYRPTPEAEWHRATFDGQPPTTTATAAALVTRSRLVQFPTSAFPK